jgi:hypothetical protein
LLCCIFECEPRHAFTLDFGCKLPSLSEPVDPRYAVIRELIQQSHLKKFRVKCRWDRSEGKAMYCLLSSNPSWSVEEIEQMVRNRFSSDDIAADRPRRWLGDLGRYAAGPLDRFNKLKGCTSRANGNANGKSNVAEVYNTELSILSRDQAR